MLKDYHANPNIVDNNNNTTLMLWARSTDRNLLIMKLLVKYGFDLANLVNEHENEKGLSVFRALCFNGNTDHNIACIKYLFAICEKIPNCSINMLSRDHHGWCGLHAAIAEGNIGMIRYLLENVYFPNSDKSNKDGIAVMNIKIGDMSLVVFVLTMFLFNKHLDHGLQFEIFELLVSYGMKVNSKYDAALERCVIFQRTKIVQFILNQNLYPIDNMVEIISLMYTAQRDAVQNHSIEILKALYNYGIKQGVISNKTHHSQIVSEAAKYTLLMFKDTMLMILEKHGIPDLKQCKQCDMINVITLETIAQSKDINQDVKSFIEALISDDETKLLKFNTTTSKEFVLTCINNHEFKNNNDNKINNYKQMCSVCGDNNDASQSLSGFKCDECKSFICHDCIIVQKISKKINEIPGGSYVNTEYELSILQEIFQYKNNDKLFNKVELLKLLFIHFYIVFL